MNNRNISRRTFIRNASLAVAGTAALTGCATKKLTERTNSAKIPNRDPNSFALIADTHIHSSPDYVVNNQCGSFNMANNLTEVIGQIAKMQPDPTAAIFCGDIGTSGTVPTAGDYVQVRNLLEPLRAAGIDVHLLPGNCDRDRNLFVQTLKDMLPDYPPVDGRLVSIIRTNLANFFLLDTLYNTSQTVTEGNAGQAQIDWLADALDAHPTKPAIVIGHHHFNFHHAEQWDEGGLLDGDDLWPVLAARSHVKAYIHGHVHVWSQHQYDGIHVVNIPTTAYLLKANEPNGWVHAELKPNGMRITLYALDEAHQLDRQHFDLIWRDN